MGSVIARTIAEAGQKPGLSSVVELIATIALGIFLITSICYAFGMFGRKRGDLAAAIFVATVLSVLATAAILFVWYTR